MVGSLQREYLIHVPLNLPVSQAVPVVFVYHGGGGTANGMLNLSKFNQVADREQFIVVYPQGIGRNWNDGRVTAVSQAHRDQIDDLAFFDAMLQTISGEHPIDERRVFVTGISNGGIFSQFVAANRSSKIAAIAPVVGGIADPFHQRFRPSNPVSVLIIQGTDDPLIPYAGGQVAAQDRKGRGSVISTEQGAQMWVDANGCHGEPEEQALPDRDPSDGCRVQARRWKGGTGGTEVWLYRIDGGGHTWPNGPQYLPKRRIGSVTRDISSETIWEFFKSHPRPMGFRTQAD